MASRRKHTSVLGFFSACCERTVFRRFVVVVAFPAFEDVPVFPAHREIHLVSESSMSHAKKSVRHRLTFTQQHFKGDHLYPVNIKKTMRLWIRVGSGRRNSRIKAPESTLKLVFSVCALAAPDIFVGARCPLDSS